MGDSVTFQDFGDGHPPSLGTVRSWQADPIGQVERAQIVFEKGPVTAVAAFFTVAFFITLFFLLRAKDKHRASESRIHELHAKKLAELNGANAAELARTNERERASAIQMNVTLQALLSLAKDIEYIAHELRRVRIVRERKRGGDVTDKHVVVVPDEGKGPADD